MARTVQPPTRNQRAVNHPVSFNPKHRRLSEISPQLSPGLESERLHPASAHRVPPGGRGRRRPQCAPAPLSRRCLDAALLALMYFALFATALYAVAIVEAIARHLWAALSAAPS